jgi:putative membrane protein
MILSLLPTLNACLNAAAAVLLLLGYRAIKAGRTQQHHKIMIAACLTAAAFLTSYVIYHSQHGLSRFQGRGPVRPIYFTILTTHTTLAVVQVPLIITTLVLAMRGRIERHRRWAKVTFPIWLYVSVTGVIIYLMLYHLYPQAPVAAR